MNSKSNTHHEYLDLSLLIPVKFLVVSAGLKTLEKHYKNNEDFYDDFTKFNFCSNAPKKLPRNKNVNFSNLPREAEKTVCNAKEKLYKKSTREIFDVLGIAPTSVNKFSPLEAKWEFEYWRKFNTLEYKKENEITLAELLRPLNQQELQEYLQMF